MNMDINEIRRINMRQLVEEAGSRKNLAQKLGVSEPRLSHLIGKTARQNIGDQIARRAETVFAKPFGWMDWLHTQVGGECRPLTQWLPATSQLTHLPRSQKQAWLMALADELDDDALDALLRSASAIHQLVNKLKQRTTEEK